MVSSDDEVWVIAADLDLTKIPLSVDEAFVASRIEGKTTLDELAIVIGRDPASTRRILKRLEDTGVVSSTRSHGERAGGSSRHPTRAEARPHAESTYAGFVFAPELLAEDNSLDEETRKRILFAHDKRTRQTLYELLGISRKADEEEIKKAYFKRSKEWHPDRFRRWSNLGSFKKRIEELYISITEAYRTLSDSTRRQQYDATLPAEPDPEVIAKILRDAQEADQREKEAERNQRRDEEMKLRRWKKNPVRQRLGRGKEAYDQARALEESGKLLEAMRTAQMAVTFDPKNEDYVMLFERLRDASREERVGPLLRRGRHFESLVEWQDAIDMYEEAVNIAPKHGDARVRLAYALLHAGRDIDTIMPHAQKAAVLKADDAEAHYVLARAYEQAGNEKSARRHYERAMELRPNYQEAKKRLKRLKWGF